MGARAEVSADPATWSTEARAAYELGKLRHDEAQAAAYRHALRASFCNGREDCAESAHLACCLTRKS